MNEGRAAPSDTTVKQPILLASPLDEIVIRVGLASLALGIVLVLAANATRPGLGALNVVPEAYTGLAAACLGWFAVALAHPSWGGPRPGRAGWLFVVSGLVVTVAVMLVALVDFGAPVALEPDLAQLIVSLGQALLVAGLTWLFIVVIFGGIGFLWRTILAAGADRWVR